MLKSKKKLDKNKILNKTSFGVDLDAIEINSASYSIKGTKQFEQVRAAQKIKGGRPLDRR